MNNKGLINELNNGEGVSTLKVIETEKEMRGIVDRVAKSKPSMQVGLTKYASGPDYFESMREEYGR